jgi:uncharacterized YigZ family protein
MIESDTFYAVRAPSEGYYKEKGSRFLAFAEPVQSVEEAENFWLKLKQKFYDARHHCYAYVIGAQQEIWRANDDGEPHHSAGDPILGQIRSFNLTNVMVVVVRYFGGTKLGVGGLVSAYKTAAGDALQNAEIVEKLILEHFSIRFAYHDTSEVMRIIREFEAEVINQEFSGDCLLEASVRLSRAQEFKSRLSLHPGIRIS